MPQIKPSDWKNIGCWVWRIKKNELRLNAFDKNVGEIIFQNEDGRWEKKTKCGRNTRDAGDLVSQGVTALRNKT